MNQNMIDSKFPILSIFFGITLALLLSFPSPTLALHPLLKKSIISYNLEALENSLIDNSYRGEEGILRIRPEIGVSLGMKVFIDQNYLDSRELFKKAGDSLKKAERAMVSNNKEKFPGEYAQKIANHFLLFKKNLDSGEKKLMAYRSRLNPGVDDRLNANISTKVMEKLLEESLRRRENRLRDALGYFYNTCQGVNKNSFPLTPENVRFVNYVFHRFIGEISKDAIRMFDLDHDSEFKKSGPLYNWKDAVREECPQYIPLLEIILKKFRNKIYPIDPLLFIALMRKESNFDPLSISRVGAVGLTQIMPQTAKYLGMRNIYMPAYLDKAKILMKRERDTRREANEVLFQISEKNSLVYARRARELMQKSLILRHRRERLFAKYRKELLEQRTDNRLKSSKAIEYGLKYFAKLMKDQGGDISLALASYNAGPHRVQEFKGLPPYAETIGFRNRVLKYYRDYHRKAKGIK